MIASAIERSSWSSSSTPPHILVKTAQVASAAVLAVAVVLVIAYLSVASGVSAVIRACAVVSGS